MIVLNRKTEEMLKRHDMIWKDLKKAGVAANTPQRFSLNRTVSTDTIDKVCALFQCQPGDLMEWIPDEEYEKCMREQESKKQEKEKQAIEAQIAELQAKLNKINGGKS